MKTVKLLLILALFLCTHHAFSQTKITGRVTDAANGTPLEGVSVKIKSTKTGTLTNKDGAFSIQVSSSDVLVFSYVGYLDQEINVNGQTSIDVKLAASIAELGQV